MSVKGKIDFYLSVLTRIDGNIAIADEKANSSLTHLFALLTILVGVVGGYIGSLKNFSISCLSGINKFILILVIFDALFFLMWYIACMKVISPDLRTTKNKQDNYDSTIFFKSINSLELEKFLELTERLNERDILTDLLKQIHIVSSIVDEKYKNFREINKWIVMTTIVFLFILLLILSQL